MSTGRLSAWLLALPFLGLLPTRALSAQGAAAAEPVGARLVVATAIRPRAGDVRVLEERTDSARRTTRRPRRVWPWVALGGSVLGAGTGVVLAVQGCPSGSGCRDDGGLAWAPVAAGAYAIVGAAAGAVVGAAVDHARRHRVPSTAR